MFAFLTAGLVLGASAGFAPGPLTALVISETLRYNISAGIRAAISPLVTDFPIILFSLLILSRISSSHGVLGTISLIGGLVLMHMGYDSLHTDGRVLGGSSQVPSASLKKGIVVNLTNPQPYLFWISVGAPTFLKALDHHPLSALAFVTGFYFLLVGAKVLTAVLVGKSRHFFTGKAYLCIMRFLGILLFLFAGVLFHDALTLFKSI
ncbi:LysE family translocator [Desulfocicer niacini]